MCAEILGEAQRLSELGRFGPPINQLVIRASELLDDMDEILVGLDPTTNGPDFALAADLHREIEYVQAAISSRRREAASGSNTAGKASRS